MALTQRLDLRQKQTLAVTAQLQQSLKILQMASLDLSTLIEEELAQNPLLAEGEAETADREQPEETETPNGQEAFEDGFAGTTDEAQEDIRIPEEPRLLSSGNHEEDEGGTERWLSEQRSLREYLLQQLQEEISDPAQAIIGNYLIEMLDEAGYLREPLPNLAMQLGCPEIEVEQVLLKMQTFDPCGIFARDLAECLRLQLQEKDRCDPAMEALLENLDLLGKRDLEGLKKICGVDTDDLMEMVAEIRALNPRPGALFSSETSSQIVPDVYVMKAKDGWHVELNGDALPKLLLNRRYYTQVRAGARGPEERKYLSEQLASASWLIKALDQRARTVIRVATKIVARQKGFFEEGVGALKPMTLKDIAEEVELHESTISRVVANKFMATPRGTVEMKFFFSSAIQGSGGDGDYASQAVKHKIKQLIEQEDPKHILSDDEIAVVLRKEGMDIARRTVAKYREALGIASSVQRRREKRWVGA